MSPELALFVELLQRTNSEAIGGTADMPRTRRARRSGVTGNKERILCGKGCLMRHRSVGFRQESWRRLYVNLKKCAILRTNC